MHYFEYGEKELNHLKSVDESMRALIERYGKLQRSIISDPFDALTQSILSQQISGKAADTIIGRLHSALLRVTPERLQAATDEQLRQCGISARKINYLRSASEYFLQNKLDCDTWATMSDEAIIQMLLPIKGVGVWTAEMMLIFCFERPDILSRNDLGIKKGLRKLYDLDTLTDEVFQQCHQKFSPYATIASFYLWECASE